MSHVGHWLCVGRAWAIGTHALNKSDGHDVEIFQHSKSYHCGTLPLWDTQKHGNSQHKGLVMVWQLFWGHRV